MSQGDDWTGSGDPSGADQVPGAPPPRPQPWHRQPWVLGLVAMATFLLLWAIFGGGDDAETDDLGALGTEEPSASPSPEPVVTPSPSASATPTLPPPDASASPTPSSAAPSTSPEPSAAPADFDPIELSGSGDDVVDLEIPGDGPAIATLTHDGEANFVVQAIDADGGEDLLVNGIGQYSGTRPLNLGFAGAVREVEIRADGAWTMRVAPLSEAEAFDPPLEGAGDQVLATSGPNLTGRLTLTHAGQQNFVVTAYGDGGLGDLLVNEIGEYSGTVRVQEASVLVIQADGNWTLAASS